MPTPLELSLQAVIARIRVRHSLRAAAAGIGAGTLALLVSRAAGASAIILVPSFVAAFVATGGLMFISRRRSRTPAVAAAALERADPTLQNLVVTAQELIE